MKTTIRILGIIALVAVIGFSMTACGGGDDGNGDGSTPNHTHDFSGVWKSNATQHWKECAADNEKGQIANHTPAKGICTVCGYNNTPGHTHDFSGAWKSNATQHWKECAADNEKGQIANHTPTDGICTVCGYDNTPAKTYATTVTWTQVAEIPFVYSYGYGIVYGNDTFVIGGINMSWWTGNFYTEVAYSSDGTAWTEVKNSLINGYGNAAALAYGNGRFVAMDWNSKTAYSTDGINWTAGGDVPFNSAMGALAYGNDRFVAGGTVEDSKSNYFGMTAYSTDGITWTAGGDISLEGYYDTTINTIAYGNGRFVAGGEWKI
jgi:hypothetical protein